MAENNVEIFVARIRESLDAIINIYRSEHYICDRELAVIDTAVRFLRHFSSEEKGGK